MYSKSDSVSLPSRWTSKVDADPDRPRPTSCGGNRFTPIWVSKSVVGVDMSHVHAVQVTVEIGYCDYFSLQFWVWAQRGTIMTIFGYCDYFTLFLRWSQYPFPTVGGKLQMRRGHAQMTSPHREGSQKADKMTQSADHYRKCCRHHIDPKSNFNAMDLWLLAHPSYPVKGQSRMGYR